MPALSAGQSPPSATLLRTGKAGGEELDVTRADAAVGSIVIQAGHAVIGGADFEAAVGPAAIGGAIQKAPHAYTLGTALASARGIALIPIAGVKARDGAWSQAHGSTRASTTTRFLSADEDQIGNPERNHQDEQVGYVAFQAPLAFEQVAE